MSNNMKPITYTILTKKQKEELQKLTEELMNLSTDQELRVSTGRLDPMDLLILTLQASLP